MTRTVRVLLLVAGVGMVAVLVKRAGARLVWDMLVRVGWSAAVVVVLYAVHISVRAVAVWRSVLRQPVRYRDVLRAQFAAEGVEMLTFTGPFLAEPTKGWLLTRRGLTTAEAFAAVLTEHLLYALISLVLASTALWLLIVRGALPPAVRPWAVIVTAVTVAVVGALTGAAMSGIGLVRPLVRTFRLVLGARRAESAAQVVGRVEDVIVLLLHANPGRVVELLAIEAVAHGLLVLETWILIVALGFSPRWSSPFIVEGGVKLVGTVFVFIPGQFGASEGVYAFLAAAIGLPAAAGLTLALVRRARGVIVAATGVVALSVVGD